MFYSSTRQITVVPTLISKPIHNSIHMMEPIKLEQFNILNQLRMKEASVTCGKCHNWLNGAIYTQSHCESYCTDCTSCLTDEDDPHRNEVQEDFIKDMQFPCKYLNCDFILGRDQIADHYTKCLYAPVQCGLCDNNIVNQFEIIKHLESVHKDNTTAITLLEPTLPVTLEKEHTNDIYIITFYERTFVLHIYRKDSRLRVELAKFQTDKDIHEENEFSIQCTRNNKKYLYSKQFICISDLCHFDNDNVEFDVKDDESVELEVRLCCFTNIMKMPECPICLNALKMEMYQCANGHNVCIDCGKKINRCANCRNASKHIVKQQHFLSNTSVMCPNANKGCLAAIKSDDIDAHDKSCSYKMVECPNCKVAFPKCQFKLHFIEKHDLQNNFKHFVFKNKTRTDYIEFKSNGFLVNVSKQDSGPKSYVLFHVVLLNYDDIAEAEKYKFEVQILGENVNEPVAKLKCQGLCSTITSKMHALIIRYDTISKYLVRNVEDEETPILNYRCIITDSECNAV